MTTESPIPQVCGVCGGSHGLHPVMDRRSNDGFFCDECHDEWVQWLAPASPHTFFLCTGCGTHVFAGSPIDLASRCEHCDADLNIFFTHLDHNVPVGQSVLCW